MTYVLGIDGGGTKTTGIIVDEDGNVVAEATVGASNPNIVGQEDLISRFTELITTLENEDAASFNRLTQVFAGISGAGHVHAQQQIQAVLRKIVPATVPITVDNDAVIALYAGTLGLPGIVQIAGTGSITYGINEKGCRGRVGGWGHLVGEEGSGYAIGHAGLQAAFSAYDGLEKATQLHEEIRDYFKVANLSDAIPKIYQVKNPKEIIASLSPVVMAVADQGDEVAQEIIHQQGVFIGKSIITLIKRLFSDKSEDEVIPVVLAGGLFKRLDLFQHSIEAVIHHEKQRIKLVVPEIAPVGGSVVAALRAEGMEVAKHFRLHYKDVNTQEKDE